MLSKMGMIRNLKITSVKNKYHNLLVYRIIHSDRKRLHNICIYYGVQFVFSFGYLLAASAAEYLSISKSHPKAEGVGEHLQCIWLEPASQ